MQKKPHIYGWEDEPIDERPSEFSSTGFTTLSGYHSSTHGQRRKRASTMAGLRTWIIVAVTLFGLGAWTLYSFARLHGH